MLADGQKNTERVAEGGSLDVSHDHVTGYRNEDCTCHDYLFPILSVCLYICTHTLRGYFVFLVCIPDLAT